MKIISFTVGLFEENTYLAICEETHEAVFIDPGDEADRLIETARKENAKPVAVFNTHAHIDHVGAVAAVQRAFGIPFRLHRDDLFWIEQLDMQAAHFALTPPPKPDSIDFLAEGDRLRFGRVELEVLHVPGHSPGHVVFFARAERTAFVGDVLFAGAIGRTDLPGGDPAALPHGIRTKLFPLGDDVRCLPGHGPPTTLGIERRSNPFVGDGAC